MFAERARLLENPDLNIAERPAGLVVCPNQPGQLYCTGQACWTSAHEENVHGHSLGV
jgi:hypothetical protein